MIKNLTDRAIRALKGPTPGHVSPTGKPVRQYDYWDQHLKGFGVRVGYGGRKAFVLRYRDAHGRMQRMTLGKYPDLGLADARKKAKEHLGNVAKGENPARAKRARRKAQTFDELVHEYLAWAREPGKDGEPRHRRWRDEDSIITRDLLPAWKGWSLGEIKRADVRTVVAAVKDRGAPILANNTLAQASRMFSYALSQDWMESNPASRVPPPAEKSSRDRLLNHEDIRALWTRLDEIRLSDALAPLPCAPATAAALQVQFLTAQRPGEATRMRWQDVDLDARLWEIPPRFVKNKRAHLVPLTAPVLDLLRTLRAGAPDDAVWVFSHSRGRSVFGRGKYAARDLSRERGPEGHRRLGFDFQRRDLRRTASTEMRKARVSRHDVSAVLNHTIPGPSATRVYDKYDMLPEKRHALETWAARLAIIVGAKGERVVSFAPKAGTA